MIGINYTLNFLKWSCSWESINIFINLYNEFGSTIFYGGRIGTSRPSNTIYHNSIIKFKKTCTLPSIQLRTAKNKPSISI